VDLPITATVTSHTLLTLPDTLTELDLLLPPDPTILNQASGRDTTLLTNAFDLSVEYPRGIDEEDPLSQFQADEEPLDFALQDNRSFSMERGRDAASVALEDEFGSIRGFNDDLDLGFDKEIAPFGGDEDDGLGFVDAGLDFGFGDEQPIEPIDGTSSLTFTHVAFAEELLNPSQEEVPATTTKPISRKRKLLTADSEIEISKKDYSQHLKDTSSILKKVFHLALQLTLATIFTTLRFLDDIIGRSYSWSICRISFLSYIDSSRSSINVKSRII
jgi:hypothetical protein